MPTSGITDHAHRISSPDLSPDRHANRIEVPVQRFLHSLPLSVVQEDHDIAPGFPGPTGVDDPSVRNRVNGISKVDVLFSDAIDVIAKMAVHQKRQRIEGEGPVFTSDR